MQLRQYQLEVLDNVKQCWLQGKRKPCIVLPCGAGKSVIAAEFAKRTTVNQKNVLFIVHRKELKDQIQNTFYNWGVNMNHCDVSMVQTVARRLEQIKKPSLIITDENHHCLANSYKKIYNYFDQSYMIGLTATPVRLNGSGLGDVNDALVESVSTKWLIHNNFLSPYDYYAPQVSDLSKLHTRRGEYVSSEIEEMLDNSKIYGDVIKYYHQLAHNQKAIVYCATVKHSVETAKAFKANGITAVHIDGTTSKNARQRIIDDFRRGYIQVLCNVDLISEGFDVPDCTAVILLRPTKSLSLYIQQSMRCMRYKENKRATIIDHVGNAYRFGLPDEDRVWSLETKKTKVKNEDEKEEKVRQCDECYFTHTPSPICPNCGYVYPKQEREEKEEIKDIKLEKLTSDVQSYTKACECQSYRELHIFAKLKGYKPGWAFYQAKSRGFIA